MISKIKTFILCIIAVSTTNSCMVETNGYTERATYSGFVALEYTGNVIRNYASILTNAYRFNQYYSQPTTEKRDSVDRLYFMSTKILRGENGNTWTLHNLRYSEYGDMVINTSGNSLNDDNTKWIVSFPEYNYRGPAEIPTFEIEKSGDTWLIKKHDSYNYEFDYSTEWKINLNSSGEINSIEGTGTLLSIESPKLKLEYSITEPIITAFEHYSTSITGGRIAIMATDVNKNITEETIVEVTSNYDVKVSYKNITEDYYYSLLQ